MNKSDPLTVLLTIKNEKGFQVDEQLIEECYKLQKEHQYDKDRTTLRRMETLIEATLVKKGEDKLL